MQLHLNEPYIVQLNDPLFLEKKVQVYVFRLDMIHPFITGNKWYKLKYNLEEFARSGSEYLVTFGGAYSNHIVSTAVAGKEFGIRTIGIIRGEELNAKSNEYLSFASQCGMKLIFVSREKYKFLREDYSGINSVVAVADARLYILPEGGSNALAIKGCHEIVEQITIEFDVITVACGTGCTLAGIVNGLNNQQRAIGFSVLKSDDFMEEQVRKLTGLNSKFSIIHDYHFGKYANSPEELDQFCNTLMSEKNIPVEPIYTGKLFYGLYDLIGKNYFRPDEKIVAVHTGGIFSFNRVGDKNINSCI